MKLLTDVISFVASFGVFVDINGVEGLIHISRLSHNHVHDATKLFKKGDPIQAKIIAIDPAKEKITLSRKELEPSPWVNVESEFPEGSRHKGVVKRFADFGTYVMVKPGVEGLLRNYDLSWGRRINHPSEESYCWTNNRRTDSFCFRREKTCCFRT
ncbi:MAG: S1 RNA-binding domain-containing protein [Microthrixaceae bacterium]